MTKTSEKPRLGNTLQDIWLVFLKTVKLEKNNERLRNCHRQEETGETSQLNTVWYPLWDPETEREH